MHSFTWRDLIKGMMNYKITSPDHLKKLLHLEYDEAVMVLWRKRGEKLQKDQEKEFHKTSDKWIRKSKRK